jgi:Glycosyl transferase family 2
VCLGGPVGFSARVRLLQHDWRDGVGAVRGEADGDQRTVWSGSLRAAAPHHGGPNGLPVACEVPASSVALKLGMDPQSGGAGPLVGRAVWVEPEIADPAGPLRRSSTPPSVSIQTRDAPPDTPLISVLTPVHDPPLQMLEEAIASVCDQTFGNWELCLSDDGSADHEVIAALERYAASDPRIHFTRRRARGHLGRHQRRAGACNRPLHRPA